MTDPVRTYFTGYLELAGSLTLKWRYHGKGWWKAQDTSADTLPRTHTLVANASITFDRDKAPVERTFFLHVHTGGSKSGSGQLPMALGAFFEPGRPVELTGSVFASNQYTNEKVLRAVRASFTDEFISRTEVPKSSVRTDKAVEPKKAAPTTVGSSKGPAWDAEEEPSSRSGSGSSSSSSSSTSKTSDEWD